MAYVEAGPADGPPVVLLHGEPTWSFLWRRVMPVLAGAGLRAIAPDLIGFGRSDKPAEVDDHTYARHVEWVRAFAFDALDLRDVTLVGHDWGGLIGLRLATENADRVARIVATNTGLPTGDQRMPDVWLRFRDAVRHAAPAGHRPAGPVRLPDARSPTRCSPAYDAPFPDETTRRPAGHARRWCRPSRTTRPPRRTGRPGTVCPHGTSRSWWRSATATRSPAAMAPILHRTVPGSTSVTIAGARPLPAGGRRPGPGLGDRGVRPLMPVRVVELDRPAQHHDLAGLFARIWRADSAADVMPASTMTAIAFAGGYVAGAYEEDRLVGGGVGFLGRESLPSAHVAVDHLHSDLVGVDPAAQSTGIGYALKQHQRQWCGATRDRAGAVDVRPAGGPQRVLQPAPARRPRGGVPAGLLRDAQAMASTRATPPTGLYVHWSTVDDETVDALGEERPERGGWARRRWTGSTASPWSTRSAATCSGWRCRRTSRGCGAMTGSRRGAVLGGGRGPAGPAGRRVRDRRHVQGWLLHPSAQPSAREPAKRADFVVIPDRR